MNNQNLSYRLHQVQVNILFQKMLVCSVQEIIDICENSVENNPFLEFERLYTEDFFQKGIFFEKPREIQETLSDNLRKQIAYVAQDQSISEIAEFIVDLLDDDGYLKFSIEQICRLTNTDKNTVERALDIVQSLEPPGIGTRSILECLILQMKIKKMDESIAFKVFSRYGNEFLSGRFACIKKEMKLTDVDISRVIEDIRKLDPFPGRAYSKSTQAFPIIPDVIVKYSDKVFDVKFAEDKLFRVFFNEKYLKLVKSSLTSDYEKKFLKEKIREARRFLTCIQNRRRFLEDIINYIIHYQSDFISGKGPLKKLTEKDVATRFNCSISLISRAISKKYVATNRGIFRLKKLFSYSSSKYSQDFIIDVIENIIDNSKDVLSDRQISEKLKEIGIHTAPRTVNKYRHKREISNSYFRRSISMLEKKL